VSYVGGRSAAYVVFPLAAAGFLIPCYHASWHGAAELHTLLETISTLLELVAGAIALKGYYTTKASRYLLLGSVLTGAAWLDGCHTLITSSLLAGKIPATLHGLTLWSEVTPRIFPALFLSSLAAKTEVQNRLVRRIGEWGVYAVVGASVLAGFLVLTWEPRPLAFDPQGLLHLPANLIPSLFFALAALAHIRKGTWKTNGFEHWLILSLVAGASAHLFYPLLSVEPYGAPFFCFHLLKILSSVLTQASLFSSVSSVYRSEADAVLQLRLANEALAEEIEEREEAEEALRRSRDELETRVQERTTDLEAQSRQLKAAHAETELFLTSIPSILIGLDDRGRITHWNPTACETFGIAAGSVMGRTLDGCGIRWLAPDIRAQMSQWLLADTLYRSDELTYERDGSVRSLGLSIRPIPSSQKEAARFLITGADLTERKKAEATVARLAAIVESVDAAIIGTDLTGKILTWNAAAERTYGYSLEEVKGRSVSILFPAESGHDLEGILHKIHQGQGIEHVESVRVKKNGERIPVLITVSPLRDASGKIIGTCSIATDITERKLLERQLGQAQKLESIGQLAAGIAHEINTPIQYVGDNIRFLRSSFARLEELLAGYDMLLASLRNQSPEAAFVAEIEALAKATRASYLRAEIPKSIEDSLDGAGRVAEIVRAIKEFSHPGPVEKTPLDINRAIESTVLVSRNEWKYVADLHAELDGNLPPVVCVPGEFNQVMLNLIVNAAHAIADVVSGKPGVKGEITVSTHHDGDWAEIRVRDTGTGIPEAVQSSIFNPFFTTKGVGKGTGQGLAIAHSVIVQKHGGTITFDTAMGTGTTFKIRLPIGDSMPEAGSGECSQAELALAGAQPAHGASQPLRLER
jgi:PAS domain S-box-containing protein